MDEIGKLMIEQLRDAHSAERQTLRAMPRLMKKAQSQALRELMQTHMEQTEGQVGRIEQALEQLGGKPGRKVCEAMRGLIEEAQHELGEEDKGPRYDVLLVASAQRIEHYEIAAYGTMVALAKAAGEQALADLLAETLAEEKDTDAKLSDLAEREVNTAFIAEVRGEENGDEDEEDEEEEEAQPAAANENPRGRGRRKSA